MSSTLQVKILEGKNLVACDRGGTSDPYCVVKVGNDKYKTRIVKETLSPAWDALFTFPIDLAGAPADIVFDVFDWNRLLKHKRMGRATVPFREISTAEEVYDKWLPLGRVKDEEVSGEIHVSIAVIRRKQTETLSSLPHPPEVEQEHPLFTAIKSTDLPKIMELVRDPKVDVNMKDNYGFTPLHAAAVLFSENDDKIIAELLHHKDINVNLPNEDKNTPLHYFAAKFRSPTCTEIFELFIKKGANVNFQNSNGETPLHKAIFNNSVRLLMVNLLISNKADTNKPNKYGETPLHYAVRLGREDVVLSLLKGGAQLDVKAETKTSKGMAHVTPLDLAKDDTFLNQKIVFMLQRAQDLYAWLDSIQMGHYKLNFIREDIYKDVLPDLDEGSLDKLQISKAGERLKILKAAKSVTKEAPAPTPADGQKQEANAAPAEEKKPKSLDEELDHLKYVKDSKDWRIPHSALEFTVKLGSGASGTVYKGIYKNTNVAIKLLKTNSSAKEIEEFKKEFHIMNAIASPYLVFFFGACIEPKMCMVMELMSRGSLYNVLNEPKFDCNWNRVFSFAEEMIKGVDVLHSWEPQVVHRDLKSLNLMVNEDYHIKVGDFGLSRFNTDTQAATMGKMVGTMAYAAPEVYFGEKFSAKSDIFSSSIILWELVVACIRHKYERPYAEFPTLRFDFQIIIQVAKKGTRPTIPETCPQAFQDLIRLSWDEHADKRPLCKEMLEKLEALRKDYEANTAAWDNARLPVVPETTEQQTSE